MKQIVTSANGTFAANNYAVVQGNSGGWYSDPLYRMQVVPTAGSFSEFRVKLAAAPGTGGSGKSVTFTLYVNDAPTALTVTISETATTGADITHSVAVVAGDKVYIKCTTANTPTTSRTIMCTSFTATLAGETIIMGSGALDNGNAGYTAIMGLVGSYALVAEANVSQIMPTGGTLKKLYVLLSADPGTAPDAYRFTLRKSGASTALTVTITANDTAGNNTSSDISVSAGEDVALYIEALNTPSVGPTVGWGMVFAPTVDGESVVLGCGAAALDVVATQYAVPCASNPYNWTTTEANASGLFSACTLQKFFVELTAAPGAGKSWTFTIRKTGVENSTIAVAIADANVANNDVAHTYSVADGVGMELICVRGSTATASIPKWGFVSYIEPPAPPPGGMVAGLGLAAFEAGVF